MNQIQKAILVIGTVLLCFCMMCVPRRLDEPTTAFDGKPIIVSTVSYHFILDQPRSYMFQGRVAEIDWLRALVPIAVIVILTATGVVVTKEKLAPDNPQRPLR